MSWEEVFAKDMAWGDARAALLDAAGGHGLADFLADKILMELLSSQLVASFDESCDGAGTSQAVFGPGAQTTVSLIVELIISKTWRSSWRVKPKLAPRSLLTPPDFNLKTFLDLTRELLPVVELAFWASRRAALPELERVMYMDAIMSRKNADIMIEHKACEIARRRAAALAYAREEIKSLPKGRMKLSRLNVGQRCLQTMQTLVSVGTRAMFVALSAIAGLVGG